MIEFINLCYLFSKYNLYLVCVITVYAVVTGAWCTVCLVGILNWFWATFIAFTAWYGYFFKIFVVINDNSIDRKPLMSGKIIVHTNVWNFSETKSNKIVLKILVTIPE